MVLGTLIPHTYLLSTIYFSDVIYYITFITDAMMETRVCIISDGDDDDLIPAGQVPRTSSKVSLKRARPSGSTDRQQGVKKRDSALKRWCFTLNGYTNSDIEHLQKQSTEQDCFIKFGEEVAPTTGMKHLQGYIILKNRLRLTQVKKIIGNTAHLEQMRGTIEQNDKYVEKDGKVSQFGNEHIKNNSQRNYGPHFQEIIDAKTAYASDSGEALEEYFPTFVKYPSLGKMLMKIKDVIRVERLKNEMDSELRPWQQDLANELNGPINNRSIIWIVDPEGNRGKTWLAKYLVLHHPNDVIRLENGKSADIKFAYTGQKTVIFDLSRSQEDHINYEVIESIKNGIFLSTKYESCMRVYASPHVVVFSNFEPDRSKLSADRWDVRSFGRDNNHDERLYPFN